MPRGDVYAAINALKQLRQPLHLVLRANSQKPIFLTPQKKINTTIQRFAAKFNIKIYESSVNATHLHLLIKFADRESYIRFVRAISGRLVQQLNFNWLHSPFTRIAAWGMISYQPRVRVLTRLGG